MSWKKRRVAHNMFMHVKSQDEHNRVAESSIHIRGTRTYMIGLQAASRERNIILAQAIGIKFHSQRRKLVYHPSVAKDNKPLVVQWPY